MDKYKVVFHIDEQVKAGLVLNNISNLITDIAENKQRVGHIFVPKY